MRGWTSGDLAAWRERQAAALAGRRQAARGREKESVLQATVERWLEQRGYWRMTPKNMAMAVRGVVLGEMRGFFGHWPQARGNPLVADLLVVSWPKQRPPLFLELKARDKWQPGQKEAVWLGLWRVAWTVGEAFGHVEEWERVDANNPTGVGYGAGRQESDAPDERQAQTAERTTQTQEDCSPEKAQGPSVSGPALAQAFEHFWHRLKRFTPDLGAGPGPAPVPGGRAAVGVGDQDPAAPGPRSQARRGRRDGCGDHGGAEGLPLGVLPDAEGEGGVCRRPGHGAGAGDGRGPGGALQTGDGVRLGDCAGGGCGRGAGEDRRHAAAGAALAGGGAVLAGQPPAGTVARPRRPRGGPGRVRRRPVLGQRPGSATAAAASAATGEE